MGSTTSVACVEAVVSVSVVVGSAVVGVSVDGVSVDGVSVDGVSSVVGVFSVVGVSVGCSVVGEDDGSVAPGVVDVVALL